MSSSSGSSLRAIRQHSVRHTTKLFGMATRAAMRTGETLETGGHKDVQREALESVAELPAEGSAR
jgi:hypothetical protein